MLSMFGNTSKTQKNLMSSWHEFKAGRCQGVLIKIYLTPSTGGKENVCSTAVEHQSMSVITFSAVPVPSMLS